MNLLCLLCVGLFGATWGYPSEAGFRNGPRRAVMFSGYYSNPLFSRNYDFVPQGSMSAVVTRDTVATNSYAGPQSVYPSLGDLPIEENEAVEKYTEKSELLPQYPPAAPVQPEPLQPEVEAELPQQEEIGPVAPPEQIPLSEEVSVADEVSTEAVLISRVTNRTPKKQKTKKPVTAEEEEEEESLPAAWPFSNRGSVPSYNAFFPITISGGGAPARTRTGGEEDFYPGAATAIANSFSTGKGGIATSHATSFGDPYLSALVRNALLNFKAKKPQEA